MTAERKPEETFDGKTNREGRNVPETKVDLGDEQHVELTLKPGEKLTVGPLELECIEVHGRHTKIRARRAPLTVKRTIDKVPTTR